MRIAGTLLALITATVAHAQMLAPGHRSGGKIPLEPVRRYSPFRQQSIAPHPDVAQISTTCVLSASPNPVIQGSALSLTANVNPAQSSGTVTFFDGVSILGVANVSGGVATLNDAGLVFGVHPLRAHYNGDPQHLPGFSPVVPVSVVVPPAVGLSGAITFATGANPQSVALADFNRDGIPDLAVANAGDVTVSILLGTGQGQFAPAVNYDSGMNPYAIAAGDLNMDGIPDLVVANSGDNTVSVLLGKGDGTFGVATSYPVGNTPVAIVLTDFNNDGVPDAAVANYADNTVSLLPGRSNGTFAALFTVAVGQAPVAITAADINGDGNADLITANSGDGSASVLLGQGNSSFEPTTALSAGLEPSAVLTADFNGDGVPDLAVLDFGNSASGAGSAVTVFPGNGDGSFQQAVQTLTGPGPLAFAAVDLSGDGLTGIVDANSSGVEWLAGNGDASFQPPQAWPAGSSPVALAAGSFDGTANTGVVVANFLDGDVAVLHGIPGACTFAFLPAQTLIDASAADVATSLVTNSPGCAWSAIEDSWVSGASSGLGGGTVTLAIPQNQSGAQRTGSYSVAGAAFTVVQAETVQQFTDVPLTDYFFDAVDLMKTKGITAGCGGSDYCPFNPVSRAQMAIFIVRSVYGGDNFPAASSTPYFNDVTSTTFGFPWIQKLFELGVTAGCGGGNFCPGNTVTRDQMAIFVVRARFGGGVSFSTPATQQFNDVPPSYFAYPWIQRMKMDSISAGCGGGNYCPSAPVVRGDMAIFIMRGAFNQLLPAGSAMIVQVTPATVPIGGSATLTLSGTGTHWAQGQTVLNPVPGITFSNVLVSSPTSLTVTAAADSSTIAKPYALDAVTGEEEAVLPNAITPQ